ncbi:hypothetical protein [uncultured Algimonas sp.]|uniref:hypothetical protein n=1 Tax=uncultured Algimonas sp. TaxID=1547920 RepID=UPI0026214F78|nr:hypothetical protein [uncultured Algimonas sp.]
MRLLFSLAILLFAGLASSASAQNLTGVFGPVVDADDHALEYRVGAILAAGDDEAEWGQRLHYERALSGSFRLRGIIATRETPSREIDYDYARIEAVWQITPDERAYQTGMRFEARTRGDGRPEEIRANWLNQWALPDDWRIRAHLMNTLQVAQRTNDELQFQGRFELSRNLPDRGVRLGLHSYVDFGDTGKLRAFKGSEAEIGPFVEFGVGEDVTVYLGTLHGLTGSSDDNQLRLFVERSF